MRTNFSIFNKVFFFRFPIRCDYLPHYSNELEESGGNVYMEVMYT